VSCPCSLKINNNNKPASRNDGLGLAILSAIVVFFFVKPLTTDGMIQEDQDVSLSLSPRC